MSLGSLFEISRLYKSITKSLFLSPTGGAPETTPEDREKIIEDSSRGESVGGDDDSNNDSDEGGVDSVKKLSSFGREMRSLFTHTTQKKKGASREIRARAQELVWDALRMNKVTSSPSTTNKYVLHALDWLFVGPVVGVLSNFTASQSEHKIIGFEERWEYLKGVMRVFSAELDTACALETTGNTNRLSGTPLRFPPPPPFDVFDGSPNPFERAAVTARRLLRSRAARLASECGPVEYQRRLLGGDREGSDIRGITARYGGVLPYYLTIRETASFNVFPSDSFFEIMWFVLASTPSGQALQKELAERRMLLDLYRFRSVCNKSVKCGQCVDVLLGYRRGGDGVLLRGGGLNDVASSVIEKTKSADTARSHLLVPDLLLAQSGDRPPDYLMQNRSGSNSKIENNKSDEERIQGEKRLSPRSDAKAQIEKERKRIRSILKPAVEIKKEESILDGFEKTTTEAAALAPSGIEEESDEQNVRRSVEVPVYSIGSAEWNDAHYRGIEAVHLIFGYTSSISRTASRARIGKEVASLEALAMNAWIHASVLSRVEKESSISPCKQRPRPYVSALRVVGLGRGYDCCYTTLDCDCGRIRSKSVFNKKPIVWMAAALPRVRNGRARLFRLPFGGSGSTIRRAGEALFQMAVPSSSSSAEAEAGALCRILVSAVAFMEQVQIATCESYRIYTQRDSFDMIQAGGFMYQEDVGNNRTALRFTFLLPLSGLDPNSLNTSHTADLSLSFLFAAAAAAARTRWGTPSMKNRNDLFIQSCSTNKGFNPSNVIRLLEGYDERIVQLHKVSSGSMRLAYARFSEEMCEVFLCDLCGT